jgi:glycolate oxidase
VPRTALPKVLKKVAEVGKKYDLQIPNVFHAGDGNLHPLILFDWRDKRRRPGS